LLLRVNGFFVVGFRFLSTYMCRNFKISKRRSVARLYAVLLRGLITYIPYLGITQQTPQKSSEISCYSTKTSLVQKKRGSDPAQTALFNRAVINRTGAIKSLSGLIILLLFADTLNCIDYVDLKGTKGL